MHLNDGGEEVAEDNEGDVCQTFSINSHMFNEFINHSWAEDLNTQRAMQLPALFLAALELRAATLSENMISVDGSFNSYLRCFISKGGWDQTRQLDELLLNYFLNVVGLVNGIRDKSYTFWWNSVLNVYYTVNYCWTHVDIVLIIAGWERDIK